MPRRAGRGGILIAARRSLPLFGGGQRPAGPTGIGGGIVAIDMDDRLVRAAGQVTAGSLGMTPIRAFRPAPPARGIVEGNRLGRRDEQGRGTQAFGPCPISGRRHEAPNWRLVTSCASIRNAATGRPSRAIRAILAEQYDALATVTMASFARQRFSGGALAPLARPTRPAPEGATPRSSWPCGRSGRRIGVGR